MKNWQYSNADNDRAGIMQCNRCRSKIDEGEFRFYLNYKLDAYVTEHRACSESDPRWAALDVERAQREAYHRDMLADCLAFKAKWDVKDLDELIAFLSN
jgi:hypothetical protein